MPRKRLLSIATFTLGAAAASCAGILGFERLSTEGGFVFDAGSTDASDGSTIQPDAGVDAALTACDELGIPDPPLDASAETLPPVLVALNLLDFGVDADGGRPDVPGFNLDRVCSPTIAKSSCATSVLEPTFARHAADKSPAGVDNAGFSLIQYINGFSKLLTAESLNAGLKAGRYGVVLRLTGWNGQPDDDQVQLEIFPAVGVLPRPDGGKTRDSDDQWVLDQRFEVAPGAGASHIKSDRAWVNGGRLVARFSAATMPLLLADDPKPFDMKLTDVILTATTTTVNGMPSLKDGIVAGRWKTSDFLAEVRTIYVKDGSGLVNKTLCDANDRDPNDIASRIYGGVKSEICVARDIRADSNDNAVPRVACDALSAGMRIDGYPITTLGVFDAGAAIAARCVDAAVPLGDDCP